jgi:hypothetical protein
LEFLIEKRFRNELYKNKQIIAYVWPKGAIDDLHHSITRLRNIFGGDRESFIATGPYRLVPMPERIDDSVDLRQDGIYGADSKPTERPSKQAVNHTLARAHSGIRGTEVDQSTASSAIRGADGDSVWSEFLLEVFKPEERVVRFAERFNAGDRWITGPVIEVFSHPFLDGGHPLAEAGWAPNQVRFVDGGPLDTSAILSDPRVVQSFERAEALREAQNKGTALQLPDNDKYALADTSAPFHDTTDLTLTLKSTKYFSILRTRPALESIPEVWMDYGNILPRGNRIPQALGMQFSALFGGREILAIYRDINTFPFPNTWSFSGEEQVDKSDLQWDEPDRMKRALLRTAQEEIFPLARIYDRDKLLSAMNIVERYIRSMRIWSVFLEGPTATFQIFCVYAFDFSIDEYADLVKGMIRRGLGQTSREGLYFSVGLADIPALLRGQNIEARPIFGGEPVSVAPDKLHPTSRYRLVRLLNVLHNQS